VIDAIAEGRAMWSSVRDAIAVLLGGNLGEIAFTLGTGLLLPSGSSPNARQLLLVNLLTDMVPSLALAVQAQRSGSGSGRRSARSQTVQTDRLRPTYLDHIDPRGCHASLSASPKSCRRRLCSSSESRWPTAKMAATGQSTIPKAATVASPQYQARCKCEGSVTVPTPGMFSFTVFFAKARWAAVRPLPVTAVDACAAAPPGRRDFKLAVAFVVAAMSSTAPFVVASADICPDQVLRVAMTSAISLSAVPPDSRRELSPRPSAIRRPARLTGTAIMPTNPPPNQDQRTSSHLMRRSPGCYI
jgi:hypothetical protein